jgi:hypothetical protein
MRLPKHIYIYILILYSYYTHICDHSEEVIHHLSKLQDQAHFYPLATAKHTLTVGLGQG